MRNYLQFFSGTNRHVTQSYETLLVRQAYLEASLHGGLIEAGEGKTSVGSFELRDGQISEEHNMIS